jgi:RNA polymerase sigma factor (sigma-70 family)
MGKAASIPILRLIRRVVEDHEVRDVSDRDLLRRFSEQRDEAAFHALLRRHGPMVFDVCRGVLGNEGDAEDAFQATFLILARKAPSLRKAASVGSWLHSVAYRAALRARAREATRKKNEARAPTRQIYEPDDLTWREVRAVVHEELSKLPERYRVALVMCYLESKRQDQAAAQLGVAKSTLKERLERGRELLKARLVRRGLGPVALLLAAAWPIAAASAKPAAQLVSGTIKAATQIAAGRVTTAGLVSTQVTALAEGVLKTMQISKSNVTAAVLLALALVGAGSAVLTCHSLAADQTGTTSQALTSQASTDCDAGGSALAQHGKGAQQQRQALLAQVVPVTPPIRPPAPEGEAVEVKGRVLGPDGQPFKGAKLFVVTRDTKKEGLKVIATTGADGGFKVVVAPADLKREAKLLATALEYGPDWVGLGKADGPRELTLRLVKDDVPIEGRILDLEGRPLAGVAVQVVSLEKPTGGGDLKLFTGDQVMPLEKPTRGGALKPWIQYARLLARGYREDNFENPMTSISPAALGLPAVVKTGKDGTFRLTGFGRERVVSLSIRERNLEYADLTVLTTSIKLGKEPLAARSAGPRRVYGPRFSYSAGPSRPIVGTVRDKRTGKAIPGVVVHCCLYHDSDYWYSNGEPFLRWIACAAQATTNDKGEYRIAGLGKHDGYSMSLHSVSYFQRRVTVKDAPGLEPLKADFKLEKGIAVRGRLTDRVTGKPVRGRVWYEPLRNNPNLKDPSLNDAVAGQALGLIGYAELVDGSFDLVALPGPGLLFVRAEAQDQYCRPRVDGQLKRDIVSLYDAVRIEFPWHAVVRINPSEKDAKSGVCDIALEPGEARAVTVVGPDGKPLTGVLVEGHRPFGQLMKVETARLTVTGLSSRTPRPVMFHHPEKRLSKLEWVKADKGRPLTVSLEPPGTITCRVVDARGRPLAGLGIGARVDADVLLNMGMPGFAFMFQNIGANKTDADGKFRLEGFIPGLKHTLHGYGKVLGERSVVNLATDLSVKSGEVKDLGVLKTKETPKKDPKKEKEPPAREGRGGPGRGSVLWTPPLKP